VSRLADALGRAALPLVALVLFALFGVAGHNFLSLSNAANLLQQAAPLAVATVGQTLVIAGGGLDISIGSVVALASVVGALAAVHLGAVAGVAAFLLAGAAAGAINGGCVAGLGVSPVITTIAMLTFASGAAFLITDGRPVSGLPGPFSALAWNSWLGVPEAAWIALAIVAAGHFFLQATDLGLHLRAVGGGAEGARLAGLRVRLHLFLPYVLSGLLTGVAALVYSAQAGSGQPNLGSGLQLTTIAAAVIGGTSIGGGRGSVWGSALGSLIIVVLSNGMILAGVTPYVQEIALGLAIIAAVLWDHFRRWLERAAAQRAALADPSPDRYRESA
jgi:ribose transport system permease protein